MALRVLVADDESDILEVIQDRLEAYGFAVATAANGIEALRKIMTERFDGVFLDVKMPGMSGIEVLEEVRKHDNRLPIIIITSSMSREAAIGAVAKGANEYVLKPFDWEELKSKIEKVMNVSL
ncbi:MAG TPA: response regulator [candidate division Zixibacteria bacterium]|nr:response regulator [candidate division Zixibacteria bacterium]